MREFDSAVTYHHREQWILAQQIVATVASVNAPFCDGGVAEGPNMQWVNEVAVLVADRVSVSSIESLLRVLESTLKRLPGSVADPQSLWEVFKEDLTYVDSSWLQQIGGTLQACGKVTFGSNVTFSCDNGIWQAYSTASSHWHRIAFTEKRCTVCQLLLLMNVNLDA